MLKKEEWRDVIEYEGLYKVSNRGNILNYKSNKKLKICISKKGYCVVGLYKNKKVKLHKVHRIVAKSFVASGREDQKTVNHIDGNKKNNYVSNLEWVSQAENNLHAIKTGLRKYTGYAPSGKKHYKFKGAIYGLNTKTQKKVFMSGQKEMLNLGFNSGCVYRCLSGMLNQHKGYTFVRLPPPRYGANQE